MIVEKNEEEIEVESEIGIEIEIMIAIVGDMTTPSMHMMIIIIKDRGKDRMRV